VPVDAQMITIRRTSPPATPRWIHIARRRTRSATRGDVDVDSDRGTSSDRTCQADIDPIARASQPATTSATTPAGTNRNARPSVFTCQEP
jgi:hypothetical protein